FPVHLAPRRSVSRATALVSTVSSNWAATGGPSRLYVVPATRSTAVWVMAPMSRERVHRKVSAHKRHDPGGSTVNLTAQMQRAAPRKVSGRCAGDAPGMPTNTTYPTPVGVDSDQLERHITEMYRDVANGDVGDLHFQTGRDLAEALGYPIPLLDALPREAV